MQRSLGLVQLDEIYLTHFHADHFLGLPGLLKTYDLTDREPAADDLRPGRPRATSSGPSAGSSAASASRSTWSRSSPGDRIDTRAERSSAFPVEHSVRACGYALVEFERPGRFDPEEAKRLGVAEGPDFAALQGGENVPAPTGPSARPT